MCTLSVSDFDALDTRDADAVLIAGEILTSERHLKSLNLAILPRLKDPQKFYDKTHAHETRKQKELENAGQHVPGEPRRGVIVH